MPAFSLRSQRPRSEALNHRLPKNLRLQNEPSPIFGQSTVGRTLSSTSARAHPWYTKRTWQTHEKNGPRI
jgi:hypothetical protein